MIWFLDLRLLTLVIGLLIFGFWILDFGTLHIGDFSFILGTFHFETLYFGFCFLGFEILDLGPLNFKTTHAHFHDQRSIFNDICRLF